MAVVVSMSCGGRRPSAAELQHKIDSVRALEQVEALKRQGITPDDGNPLRTFYDSLAIQPLPLSYSAEYVAMLPNFKVVPAEIVTMLELEGRTAPKAIALPDMMHARLVLLAADVADGEYELWLYSIDDNFMPVDKLLLYEPTKISDRKIKQTAQEVYFSITSDCEINLMEYLDDEDTRGQMSTFIVDPSRMFVEQPRQTPSEAINPSRQSQTADCQRIDVKGSL